MPELKQIEVSLELGTSNTKLKEYGARYSDGHVETFVAVPETDMPFSIHITTKHYIAPGIAFFVFMDGEYQCNRNRIGLRLPADGVDPNEYETEFRMRQKEEKNSAGTFVAREWSFAKLNTVAADKAPSLNQGFVQNVGTIEIVAMRCRPASDDIPQPQISSSSRKPDATPQEAPSKTSKAKPATQPTPAPTKAPSKPASAANEDVFGGLMGLFDGACDSMGLDGANDEREVFDDSRVNAKPPPGSYWDSNRGKFRHNDQYSPTIPDTVPNTPADIHAGGPERAKAFVAKAMEDAQAAQFDGNADWLASYSEVYPRQPQDDLRGDKYLGMTGRDRSDYKQFFRERGDAVSRATRPVICIGAGKGFVCNDSAGFDEIEKFSGNAKSTARIFLAADDKGHYAMDSSGEQLLGQDLQRMHSDISKLMGENPTRDFSDSKRRYEVMQARLQKMQVAKRSQHTTPAMQNTQQQSSFSAVEEALEDVQLLRTKLKVVGQSDPGPQISGAFERLQKAESHLMEDSLWSDEAPLNELDALNMRREQLRQRNALMSEVVKVITGMKPGYHVDNINKRIEAVCEEARNAGKRIIELRGRGSGFGQRTPGASAGRLATPRHVNFQQQGYDGAPRSQTAKPTTPQNPSFWLGAADAPGPDWQQIGAGSLKPSQQAGQWGPSKQPSTHEHFPNENLNTANNWNTSSQKPPIAHGGGAANTWADTNQNNNAPSQAGSKRGWDTGVQQQQGGAGWGNDQQDTNAWAPSKPASQHAGATGWGPDSSSQESKADKNDGSQRSSQNNDGGDKWNNEGASGNGWGGQSNKAESNSGGWGQQSNANGSKSGRRSVASESIASSPKDLIKPYWKDWDKAGAPGTGETGSTAKKREAARPVYTYAAAKLPAIPEGKIASATHGIQTGRGAEYNHLCRRPIYIDTMERPYAVFSFKYRSKEKLKQITGLNVKSVDEDVKAVQKQAQKDKLMQMPKDELIERLMKTSVSKSGSQKAPSASGGSGWGNKPASNADGWDTKSKKSAGSGGWGANNNSQAGGAVGWGGSNHTKSKKSEANGWAGTQEHWAGGGNGRWDGQDDVPEPAATADGAAGSAASGGFKWPYDAFRTAQDEPAASKAPSALGGFKWPYDALRVAQDEPAASKAPSVPGEFKWPYDAFRTAQDEPAASKAPSAPSEFKWPYDDFRVPEDQPATTNAPPGKQWQQETDGSIFEAPDGIIYRGEDIIGYKSWAGSEVKRKVDARK